MSNFTPAYRRAAYFIVAAILAVLVAAGLITEEQYDSWTSVVEQLLPILGTIALSVAGAKTNYGSDDPTTREDVQLAYQATQPVNVVEPEPAPDAPISFEPDAPISFEDEAQSAYHQATFRE